MLRWIAQKIHVSEEKVTRACNGRGRYKSLLQNALRSCSMISNLKTQRFYSMSIGTFDSQTDIPILCTYLE